MRQKIFGFLRKILFGHAVQKTEGEKEEQKEYVKDVAPKEPIVLGVQENMQEKTESAQKDLSHKASASNAFSGKTTHRKNKTTKTRHKKTQKKHGHRHEKTKKEKIRHIVKLVKKKALHQHKKQIIVHKKSLHKRHEKIKRLEEKVAKMAHENSIPEQDLQEMENRLSAKEVVRQPEKVADLKEIEKKVFGQTNPGQKEILGLMEEIKKHRILTDFDRVYSVVLTEKRIQTGKIAATLLIPKTRVEDCAEILEQDKLVEIDYPALGDAFIQVPEYKPKKIAKKVKK